MKEFILEFLSFLAKAILIICLVLTSFLFVINVYHYKDVTYSYPIDLNKNGKYIEYKKLLKSVDKKMEKVNYNSDRLEQTAKPIHDYYKSCIDSLNKSSFSKFASMNSIKAIDVYHANDEILQDINDKCMFSIAYNIKVMAKAHDVQNSFSKTDKVIEQKRNIVLDNSYYLVASSLGNSSYSFTTNITKVTIYNKLGKEFGLTLNDYYLVASILDDIADWYVLEYGGNE